MVAGLVRRRNYDASPINLGLDIRLIPGALRQEHRARTIGR